MAKNRTISTGVALSLGLGLLLALLWALGSRFPVVRAQGSDGNSIYYVAPSCSGLPTPCYDTVQAAVDAADHPDDVIKVAAGTYTDIHQWAGITRWSTSVRPSPSGAATLLPSLTRPIPMPTQARWTRWDRGE
jgi:hypothetical protein